MANKVHKNGWYLWSSHGVVLFHIAIHPGCTVAEIAEGLCLTQRTVWGAIGDLRRAEMLHVERRGRKHHYTINMDARFRAPQVGSVRLGTVFGALAEENANGATNHSANGHASAN
ncbi:MAG TPA: winged helix-turn-helix domain-containing protein [Dehalococcoidia bacterium]|jgi:hypothetical protein|nr:winged helix-turn-helix domain-containing protein [Dehalococcoidia bacterium]